MMVFSRANGRGFSLGDWYLPKQSVAFGGRGIVCPMTGNDFATIPIIAESQPSICPSPFFLKSFCGSLQSFGPVSLEMVSPSPLEPLWDSLVRQYHYLGYQRLLGHRLKYLGNSHNRRYGAQCPKTKTRI